MTHHNPEEVKKAAGNRIRRTLRLKLSSFPLVCPYSLKNVTTK
jgi:hypothetical protein